MDSIEKTKVVDSLTKIRKRNVENREKMIDALRMEFIGKGPFEGEELDCTQEVFFENEEEAFKLYIQKGSKEEIIQRGTPLTRYGVAILFPTGQKQMDEQKDSEISFTDSDELNEIFIDKKEIEKFENREADYRQEVLDDFDISTANSFRPNSMAVSFKANITEQSNLIVHVTGGRYTPKTVFIRDKEKEWWLRSPVQGTFTCSGKVLLEKTVNNAEQMQPIECLDLEVKVISRPQNDGTRLITVSLTNRTDGSSEGKIDSLCLFQSAFTVTIEHPSGAPCILPYPEGDIFDNLDDEEKSIALLYRNLKTYAVGHGCAADWGEIKEDKVYSVRTEFLPTFETRSMTPDIKREDGTKIEVSMKQLAGLYPERDGFHELEEIISLYRLWIQKQRKRVALLDPKFHKVANANLDICEECADRMERGLSYLKTDKEALTAFRLANHAVLLQQITGDRRSGVVQDGNLVFNKPYEEPNLNNLPETKGKWRAFQVAFLLMSIHSAGEKDSVEREIIDLIFFPTGGGKTEAYLGLAAFSMFMRRIKDKNDHGVEVLMRYTLRLLTADQFQRSSRLICAMEYLRRQHEDLLGTKEFSIGIWLGGDTTPNTNDDALKALNKIKNGKIENNPFILNACPWCGAKLGEYRVQNLKQRDNHFGRRKKEITLRFMAIREWWIKL